MPIFSPKLIYSAATVRGWWIPRWLDTQNLNDVRGIVTDLLNMIVEGRLTLPPVTSITLGRFQEAIALADGGSLEGNKVLLELSDTAH
jgi:NADPH2:quinone reductase